MAHAALEGLVLGSCTKGKMIISTMADTTMFGPPKKWQLKT